MPNVYNISPRYPFLDVLTSYIIETAKSQNLNVANDIILLPTRRACRHIKSTFLKLSKNDAAILPYIYPLGDIDEDEISISDHDNYLTKDIKKSIPKVERALILSKIVKDYSYLGEDITEEQSYSLAVELAHLMDTVEMEQLDFKNLDKIVPDEYSIHWQETLKFLKVITEEYPKLLSQIGYLNPIDRKIKLIEAQVDFWKRNKPKGRIFACGSTGSLIPISKMLQNIANMDNGYLILPGLDKNLTEKDIKFLLSDYPTTNQNHPQYSLVRLVNNLGVKIADVPDLPLYDEYDATSKYRELLSSQIMAFAEMDNNVNTATGLTKEIIDGISYLNMKNEAEEVFAISHFLRKVVFEKKKAILITPDRKIAKSVSSYLKKWNIVVDDSAGIHASDSITGNYIILVLKMIYKNFEPFLLLSVLRHKYTNILYNKNELNEIIQKLEIHVLRKGSCFNGLDSILDFIDDYIVNKLPFEKKSNDQLTVLQTDYKNIKNLILHLKSITKNFTDKMTDGVKYNLYDLLKSHLELVETFVNATDIDTTSILWGDDNGNSLSDELRTLLKDLENIKTDYSNDKLIGMIDGMTAKAYFTFISNYLFSISLRPTSNFHPNIAIMNSIEARLLDADYYILSGLNEQTFPRITSDDPWMNRSMKAEFKLPLPEKKIGLSSHDFTEFFCKKNIILTNSNKVDGFTTIPSRWITKLDAILKLNNLSLDTGLNEDIKSWWNGTYRNIKRKRISKPTPVPPLYARPKKLSATWIEKWYQDPYTVFAGKILKLKKLDEINKLPGASDIGTIIHKSLETYKLQNMTTVEELKNLLYNSSKIFKNIPEISFWQTKFNDIATWFIEYEKGIIDKIEKTYVENEGEFEITNDFTITANADRIDILKDNTICIYDYKTGTAPTKKSVKEGIYPQLLIEAIILKNNGFKDIRPRPINALKYIKLGNLKDCQEIIIDEDIDELINLSEAKLLNTIKLFSDPNTPYTCRPNEGIVGNNIKQYGEFNHLARVKEWMEN